MENDCVELMSLDVKHITELFESSDSEKKDVPLNFRLNILYIFITKLKFKMFANHQVLFPLTVYTTSQLF